MTAAEIVKELERRGYQVTPREGLANSYTAAAPGRPGFHCGEALGCSTQA